MAKRKKITPQVEQPIVETTKIVEVTPPTQAPAPTIKVIVWKNISSNKVEFFTNKTIILLPGQTTEQVEKYTSYLTTFPQLKKL